MSSRTREPRESESSVKASLTVPTDPREMSCDFPLREMDPLFEPALVCPPMEGSLFCSAEKFPAGQRCIASCRAELERSTAAAQSEEGESPRSSRWEGEGVAERASE